MGAWVPSPGSQGPSHRTPHCTGHHIGTRSTDLSSLDLEQFCANVGMPRVGSRNRTPSVWDCLARTCQGCPSQPQRLPREPGSGKNCGGGEQSPSGKCGRHLVQPHSPPRAQPRARIPPPPLSPSQPVPVSWPPVWPFPKSVIQPVNGPLAGGFWGLAPRPLAASLELAQVLVEDLSRAQG